MIVRENDPQAYAASESPARVFSGKRETVTVTGHFILFDSMSLMYEPHMNLGFSNLRSYATEI